MTAPEQAPTLDIERPFNWGILILSDADPGDIPELDPDRAFAASRHALVVAVRHSQDVNFETMELGQDDEVPPATVSVRVGPGDHESADFSCVLDIPTGMLHVGDAEHQDVLRLPPGPYVLSVRLDDVDHAEAVDVRWSPAR